jgi:hypothetical protein
MRLLPVGRSREQRKEMVMLRRFLLVVVVGGLACMPAATAGADASMGLQASFVDVYSQCPTSPPTLVFCTSAGNVVGYGAAAGDAKLTGPPLPIGGSDCVEINALRTITLASGAGSLTLTETGTKCPPSDAANTVQGTGTQGDPYTVSKTISGASGTGVFAGVCGATGTDVNRSAGNAQVSVLSGTLTTC